MIIFLSGELISVSGKNKQIHRRGIIFLHKFLFVACIACAFPYASFVLRYLIGDVEKELCTDESFFPSFLRPWPYSPWKVGSFR